MVHSRKNTSWSHRASSAQNTAALLDNPKLISETKDGEKKQQQHHLGRKRRPTPGLVDRSADVTFHQQDVVLKDQQSSSTAKPLSAIGVNVDPKLIFRSFPELRTPSGAGNSFKYRSVARSILRRKFGDESNWCGTPHGDPVLKIDSRVIAFYVF